VILKSGTMVTIVPEPPPGPPEKDWRRTVGMFQDTPAFRAMIAEGRAIREADREATLAELDAEPEDS
jgi:hypothetical protein